MTESISSQDVPRAASTCRASLEQAANALSTAVYLLADEGTAAVVGADSQAAALREVIAARLSTIEEAVSQSR